ncbi:unnamed protein product, partial [Brenthis ino]
MAMKLDGSNTNSCVGVKFVGDLGDLQVIEENESEDDKICQNQKVLRPFNNKPNIPSNLIQSTLPVFGKVTVANSENVQFGNNTYFNGPVTIKQVIQNKSGVDNSGFVKNEDDDSNTHHPRSEKVPKNSAKKEQVLLWHKITFSTVCITVIGSIIAIVLVLQNKNEQRQDSQKDFESYKTTTDTTVVGFYFENFQVIIMSVILLLLTLIISYSLLTKESIGNGMVCVIKKNKTYDHCFNQYSVQYTEEDNPLLIAPDHLRIVSRTDWLAQPEEGPLTKLRQPIPWVIITHTATETCITQSKCVLSVRLIQSFHIESRGWYDIGYNFLVGGDGSVYYGRGWDYEGAHTKGYNKYSVGIAFIGTFNSEGPPKHQVEACEKIIAQGVRLGKLTNDYKLFAHRQLMSTLSPGDKVYDIIKTWPHFVKNVTDLETLIPNY